MAIRLFGLVEDVGEVALATVLAVVHSSHEDTSTALDKKLAKFSQKDCYGIERNIPQERGILS